MGAAYSRLVFLPPRPSSYSETDLDLKWSSLDCLKRAPRLSQSVELPERNVDEAERGIPYVHYKWFGLNNEEAEYTILFSHGNAEDIGQSTYWMRKLSKKLQVDIVTYDYIGYGLCKGKPSESKTYKSIYAVYQHLVNTGVNSEKIILYGRSLGSGPTVHLAKILAEDNKEIAAVVLQSPLSSAIRVMSRTLAALPIDMFENIKKIDKFKYPVYIVHGTQDEVVPYWHSEELIVKVRNLWRFKSLEGAGHNNIESDYTEIHTQNLQDFLEYLNTRPNQDEESNGNMASSNEGKNEAI